MKRSMAAVCGAATLLTGLTFSMSREASSTERTYVKVEIRGRFVSAGAEGRPETPVVEAEGMIIELQFGDQPANAGNLQKLSNQTVIVRGTLRRASPDRLICVVEGDVVPATQGTRDAQYLIGYQEGQEKAVESLSQSLGLKVLDRYEPGKYLVVEPTEKADDKFLEKLKENRAVRYVEKNMEVRIPEKKGADPD
jgi:acyl-coenzyme A thioesterase PaaI-like protein